VGGIISHPEGIYLAIRMELVHGVGTLSGDGGCIPYPAGVLLSVPLRMLSSGPKGDTRSIAFRSIPQHSAAFRSIPWHSAAFRRFRAVPQHSAAFRGIPWHSVAQRPIPEDADQDILEPLCACGRQRGPTELSSPAKVEEPS